MISFVSSFNRRVSRVLDFLLPPLCLGCDQTVTENQTLCAECWHAVNFIAEPCCGQCGLPFDFEVEAGTLCGQCHAQSPAFSAARSAFIYDEASKGIILKFKHADQLHPTPALAQWMVRAGQPFWGAADVIMPVPLHRWRLLKRRYNQSALLAREIGGTLDLPVMVDGLVRKRATPPQGRMGRSQRQKNVTGAFDIKPGVNVTGQRIVLIDDVMTSGATVNACAALLIKRGAAMVNVLTLARVA